MIESIKNIENFTHIEQTNTGNFSYFNCGPAVCVAAVKYQNNVLDNVAHVRSRQRGWVFWTFNNIMNMLDNSYVAYRQEVFKGDILPVNDGIVIVNVDMKLIPHAPIGRSYLALPLIPFRHYLTVIGYNSKNNTYIISDPLETDLSVCHTDDLHQAIKAQCTTYLVIPAPKVKQQEVVLSYGDDADHGTND